MMKEIQILKSFSSRTEYKVLRQWVPVKEVAPADLEAGHCVIPAVVLGKLGPEERGLLVNWAREWGNQLLVFPPYHNIDLKERLELDVDLAIKGEAASLYEGVPLKESFLTNHKPKLQLVSGQVIALDVFYHSGSGQVTMTTLPLLDYRLLLHEDKCKEIFLQLLSVQEDRVNETDRRQEFELTPLHQNVLILAAAGITAGQLVSCYLSTHFNTAADQGAIELAKQQLQEGDYLAVDGGMALKGQEFIQQRGCL